MGDGGHDGDMTGGIDGGHGEDSGDGVRRGLGWIGGHGGNVIPGLVVMLPMCSLKPIMDKAADEAIKHTAMKQKQRWEEDDTYCKGYILGGLFDTLYDVYEIKYANSTAKELWDDLDSKYKTEDAGNKKFLISKLFDFRMELKQKKDAMTMQELVKYIQVEENSRNLDRPELEDNKSSKTLVVDHGSLSGSKQIGKVKTQSMRIKFTLLRKWGKEVN
ncbi:hypothetical protein RJ639_041937 [Escallonia herrerae]|uniref:Zinc finger, CCHC-type n=1 Tax=Escallonia herrerae TaxID=1293975 RepID=A0AA88WDI6_9ASTE|nr:hypothetical protein RJ639_041937 [Escallonia herrerae]